MKNTTQQNSLIKINSDVEFIKQEIHNFSPDNYQSIKEIIEEFSANIEFLFLERIQLTEDKYKERVERYKEINKKTKEYNKNLPRQTLIEYLKSNPEEFIDKKLSRIGHFKDRDLFLKSKSGNIKNFIPEGTPKKLIDVDPNYCEKIKNILEQKKEYFINILFELLEKEKTKHENIFQDYLTTSELFDGLNIVVRKNYYPFFAKEKKENGSKGGRDGTKGLDVIKTAPKFKKIGFLMKYLKDNNIKIYPNTISKDENNMYQIYISQKNITILISDEIENNCFRDSTYFINGMVPGLKNMEKDELKSFNGKMVRFNENWAQRIELILNEDPSNWPMIGQESLDIVEKFFITDKEKFIKIIKDNFTEETLNSDSYGKFALSYNRDKSNNDFMRLSLLGNKSLLGIGSNLVSEDDIKKSIFGGERKKLEIPEGSYFKNEHTKQTLIALSKYRDFSPDRCLGSINYQQWILILLKNGYKAKSIDEIKNKSQKEKKDKIIEVTGINIPIFPTKITSMLGGRIGSNNSQYQKMLWNRFVLYIDEKRDTEKYYELNKKILDRETQREENSLRPNEKVKMNNLLLDEEQQNNAKEEFVSYLDEKNQTEISKEDTVQDPNFDLDTFPFHEVKVGKIIGETDMYRKVKILNCNLDLRLQKNDKLKKLSIGDRVEVFATIKNYSGNYIKVLLETRKGFSDVAKFKQNNQRNIGDFVKGQKYPAVISNIKDNRIELFINSQYIGIIKVSSVKSNLLSYNVGDVVEVIFKGINDIDKKIVDLGINF